MRVCIRVDASLEIGSGHVMRCLTLAEALTVHGAAVSFACREQAGDMCDYIGAQGYPVHRLPGDLAAPPSGGDASSDAWRQDAGQMALLLSGAHEVDWLVVDHYRLDSRWEKSLRHLVRRLMVIDDLANRQHDCDLILDQNFYSDMATRYDLLVPQACTKMLGPSYALLRREFREARGSLRERDGVVRRILVFFGACDLSQETGKTLQALSRLNRSDIGVDVVVGAANPCRAEVQALCSTMENASFHVQVPTMAKLMADADLFIGAGGTTTWERSFLGLPSIVLSLAENQLQLNNDMAAYGALRFLGESTQVTVEHLASEVRELLASPGLLREMGRRGMALMQPIVESPTHSVIPVMTGGSIVEPV